ncbi:hypothetical protein SAMN04487917_110113 [Arthrobacter sp. yr096]|uniref:hypothetical protein n=1 Tax=Arthrobacter sp. yr096 TaxID=1761750 RepID=UPI0008B45B97|nr:hypothetical protein [Arthrobacter sp. yr096]SEJ71099.1 hypothetical protein SAMN04487917_110113 [Arthrobacter sp. yr096]
MKPVENPQPSVVRLFPDYGDTVLWLNLPIDYELTGLPGDLVDELRAWELSYYASLTPEIKWKSAALATRFTEEGNRLAQRVADELGPGFEIEFRSYEEGVPTRRFRGIAAANATAVAAFTALVTESRDERLRISDAVASSGQGGITGWYAYAPRSGSVFESPPAGQE